MRELRSFARRGALAAALGLLALLCAAVALAATPPPDFEERVVASGFQTVTDVDFAPDGRIFVAEKRGVVRVIRADGTKAPAPLVDISGHVNNYVDRGLLGIAVDSDFASNGYLYLLYVLQGNTSSASGPKRSRLTRVTVRPDNTVANPSSPETVILGKDQPPLFGSEACPPPGNFVDCIPADSPSHVIGTVRSDPDGTLWVGSGDANSSSADKTNSFRAYNEQSFAGKIIHVDRAGRGLANHPFCPQTTNLAAVCTKIYAKGFRNPFRFTLRPDGRGPVVGDVGEKLAEEVNLVRAGKSYGWPCYEGTFRLPSLQSSPSCQQEYAKEGTADAHEPPLWSYGYGETGGAGVVAGPQYTGDQFPTGYRNSIFVGDFVQRWMKRLVIDDDDRLVRVEDFAGDWFGVDLEQAPNGELVWADLTTGSVRAFRYAPSNRVPAAVAKADRTSGALPLTVQFSGAESSDPDGDELSYHWDFGDGSAASTERDPVHVYQSAGVFTAKLTVRDPSGASASEEIEIHAGNEAPSIEIHAPTDGSRYRNGEPVELRASATDPDDGPLGDSSIRWNVVLHHNVHTHPFDELQGAAQSFTPIRDHDADSFYEITAIATDSGGLTARRTVEIRPETVRLTIASEPPGAPVSYADTNQVAPYTTTAAVGFDADISAATEFVAADKRPYVFDHWSDGGEQSHKIRVPGADATFTAVYRLKDPDPPDTTITQAPGAITFERTPQFKFVATEPATFECRVDHGSWVRCYSGWRTPRLENGQHTVWVRAIDHANNTDPSPASSTFSVIGLFG